jgi:hypothetical protein
MLDFSDYFQFSEKMTTGTLRVEPLEDFFFDSYDFLACKEEPFEVPVFVHYMGGRIYDVIPSGYPGIYLVSKKFVDVLEINNFTGWNIYPARVYDKENRRIKDYSGFRVCGKCGPQLKDMSEDTLIEYPAGPTKGKKGLYFDPKTHDRSDIFIIDKSAYIIMHFKVKECLEKAKITNAEFTKLTEYKYSWF